MALTSDRRIVIFAHGSKDSRWQLPFTELANELEARLGVGSARVAYMEFISPTLMEVAEEAVKDEKHELLVLPFFLAAGGHVAADIPVQVAAARRRFPQLRIELAPPIGEHPSVKALFRRIACEYAQAAPGLNRPTGGAPESQ